MDTANTLNGELRGLIARLNRNNRQALAKYAAFLYKEQEKEAPRRQAEKEEALRRLSKHRGILGNEDPGEAIAEAMREKYGRAAGLHERAV